MKKSINSQDIYKIISAGSPGLIKEDDFGLVDVPTRTVGGHGGNLGSVQGDPTRRSQTSNKKNTDSKEDPQDGKTPDPSAGEKPVDGAPNTEPTDGAGDSPEPAPKPEKPEDQGDTEKEKPEETPDLGQAGLIFLSKDLAIPEGATPTRIGTMQAKIRTSEGTLTIINKGISPESDILEDDPKIVYTLKSDRGGEEKSEDFEIPFSVVRRSNSDNHFAMVLAHLKGKMKNREALATTPPEGD